METYPRISSKSQGEHSDAILEDMFMNRVRKDDQMTFYLAPYGINRKEYVYQTFHYLLR